jgi:transposase
MINGVLWRTRTGAPWRDVPSSYGNWKGIYSRHRRWSGDGTWELILDRLRAGCDAGDSEWTVGVDSSVVRAHQHAAGARHQPPQDIPAERLAPMLPPAPQPAPQPDPQSEVSAQPDPQSEVVAWPEGHTGGWVE